MYEVTDVLQNIEANRSSIMLWGSLAFIGAFIQYGEGIRLGFRDRSHAIPIAANTFFFAHDSLYVLKYQDWLNLNNWYFTNGIAFMGIFVILELIVAWQIITYSREEIGLGKTWFSAFLSYCVIQAGMFVLFLWFRDVISDPLYLICFASSIIVSNLFNIPMLLKRGSRKGQSLLLAVTLAIQTGPIGYFCSQPLFSASFSTPTWMLTGTANTVLALAYVYLLTKTPAWKKG